MSAPKAPELPPSQKPQPLFQLDNGTPLYFFIHPGKTKLEVAPLILKHGGRLCPKIQPWSILLAREGEIPPGDTRIYISTSYITNSIAQKKRLPLEKYLLNPQPRKIKKGQVLFTKAEDWAILSYVQKRKRRGLGDNLTGTTFWMDMAEARVTPHPWQAMRNRYLRHLRNLARRHLQSRKRKRIVPKPRPHDKGAGKEQVLRTPDAEFLMYKKLIDAAETQDPGPATSTSEPPSIFQMANKEFEDIKAGSRKRSARKEIFPENTEPKTVAEDEIPPDAKRQAVESTSSEDLTMSESLLPAEKPPSGPSAEDVALAVEDMKRLMEEFGVDLTMVTQAFLKNSGEVAAAACCLETGQRSDGCPLWTRQDDLDLLSGEDDLRSNLLSKFGAENVNAREAFRKN